MPIKRAEFAQRATEYRRLNRALNRKLLIALVTLLVSAVLLARWMERTWGSGANWPYALLMLIMLIVSGGGLAYYVV
jgi:uncharacterized membrane protein